VRRLAIPALVLLIAGCAKGPSLPSYGVVPDFILTDQTGRPFSSRAELDGKVWAANFIFTNCAGPCPRMSSQFRKIRAEVGHLDNFRQVSFTIDPARDTADVLASYGKRFDADPARWFFLTGAQSDLHNLSRNVFKLGNIDGTLEHSTRFVLIDGKGRIRGYYDSSDPEKLAELLSHIRLLVEETH
jgi:cytochrome oxidase Cu insertion factor (SCO1/SenC/PrrC family)